MSKRTAVLIVRVTRAEKDAVMAEAARRKVAYATIVRESLRKRNTRNN